MADSEADESMNESQDDHNTTYNTDGVDEEDPGTVDPDVATFEEIFGADDDEEEEERPTKATYEEEIEEETIYDERPQQAIGSPLRLVTNPLPTPPEDSEIVRVKLPNIVGIQSKPFTHQALDEELSAAFDDEDDEGRKKKHTIAESQIRWRYAADGTKESNARIVRWSDGSMHLMLGNELLEMTPHNLTNEHLYLYARQPGFLQSHGRLNKKVVIRPASLDNKLHQKLSMALAEKNQKISKVKLVTTIVDPELEKSKQEELETKRLKTQQGSQVMKSRIMNRFGLDSDYLEQTGDYDRERDNNRHDNRHSHSSSSSSSFSSQSNRGRFGRNEYDKSDGFIEDDEDEEEDELDDRRDRNKHKKRSRRDEEDTERLMNAKRDVEAPKKQLKATKEKEKEKKPSRKEDKREEEEEEEEETTTTTTTTAQDVAEIEGEDEETNVVKRPAKARKGVIVDDDEDM